MYLVLSCRCAVERALQLALLQTDGGKALTTMIPPFSIPAQDIVTQLFGSKGHNHRVHLNSPNCILYRAVLIQWSYDKLLFMLY
jgi:hypothetical protein